MKSKNRLVTKEQEIAIKKSYKRLRKKGFMRYDAIFWARVECGVVK